MPERKELGDFQTPPRLALRCAEAINRTFGTFDQMIEPTCGIGRFLLAAAETGIAGKMVGIELQPDHLAKARKTLRSAAPSADWALIEGDAFEFNFSELINIRPSARVLALGNLPWVTVAELGMLGSKYTPERKAVGTGSGINASTGESNFDVAEYIFERLLSSLPAMTAGGSTVIAFLIKTSVARRLLTRIDRQKIPIRRAMLWRIDAGAEFGVSVDACLFAVERSHVESGEQVTCEVLDSLAEAAPVGLIGIRDGELVADVAAWERSRAFDGKCPLEWRQGIKHDVSKVMELRLDGDVLCNGYGATVDVEEDWVFPLLKCSDVYHGRTMDNGKRVIVTQRHPGEDTNILRISAPRLWGYLNKHRSIFAQRKSSIYQGRPSFSMFGIGSYTFAPWKVAISGMHKDPRFRLIGPSDGRPVCLDDTCYLLSFEKEQDARCVSALLNSPSAQAVLHALLFTDAKRPITKKLLNRLDLSALLDAEQSTLATEAIAGLRALWSPPAVQEKLL